MFTENGSVILSNRSWSVTTCKHQSELYQATKHLHRILVPGWADDSHDTHQKLWLYDVEQQVAKLARARKPELYVNVIHSLKESIEAYHNFYQIEIPEMLALLLTATSEKLTEISKEKS